MSIELGVVMDPIGSIKIQKDSTFAMLLAAQRRGWPIWYMELADLSMRDGQALGRMRGLEVMDDPNDWYRLGAVVERPLAELATLLMRKDPPFDIEYIFATYLLEQAHAAGCLVVNDPRSLRDANEKIFTTLFPHCTPPTLITRQAEQIRDFHREHQDVIVKPLDGMGGASVFRVRPDDPNLSVIIESLTARGQRFCMVQRFIPEIRDGDKRVLMVDGAAIPYCLARIPAPGETRGNLAAGARARAQPLSEQDHWIAAQVGPELRARGILFAGLDIIGEALTEINVTSPTCIREIDAAYATDIAGTLLDVIERKVANGSRRDDGHQPP